MLTKEGTAAERPQAVPKDRGMSESHPVFDRTAPMRLAHAVEIAFPHGGMTVSGLRKEATKGRLVIERIAGKDFVTLTAIDDMRAACRNPAPKRSRARQAGSEPRRSRLLAFEGEAANRRKLGVLRPKRSRSGPTRIERARDLLLSY
jgi:hypothetical protein